MAGGHVNRERQAEHMAAPHRFCDVKIFLANSEPSTHGPNATCRVSAIALLSEYERTSRWTPPNDATHPNETSSTSACYPIY